MPRFLMKVSPDRDAYVEWSTIVDAPVAIGTRAEFAEDAKEFPEERLARTDLQGTSARWYGWLPPEEQEGGWAGSGLIVQQRGFLPRSRMNDVYDLLSRDIDAEIPDEWLNPFDDDDDDDDDEEAQR